MLRLLGVVVPDEVPVVVVPGAGLVDVGLADAEGAAVGEGSAETVTVATIPAFGSGGMLCVEEVGSPPKTLVAGSSVEVEPVVSPVVSTAPITTRTTTIAAPAAMRITHGLSRLGAPDAPPSSAGEPVSVPSVVSVGSGGEESELAFVAAGTGALALGAPEMGPRGSLGGTGAFAGGGRLSAMMMRCSVGRDARGSAARDGAAGFDRGLSGDGAAALVRTALRVTSLAACVASLREREAP